MLTALPLYHIFAFTANLMVFFAFGGRNILMPCPRPLANLKQALTTEGATWLTGVNTLFAGPDARAVVPAHTGFAEGHGGRRHGARAGGWRALGSDDEDADVPGLRPHGDVARRVARAVPSQQARVDWRAGAGTDIRIVDADGRTCRRGSRANCS